MRLFIFFAKHLDEFDHGLTSWRHNGHGGEWNHLQMAETVERHISG